MKASTIKLSRISKTKKRLSNSSWNLYIITLAASFLAVVYFYCFRTVTLSFAQSAVYADIPVLWDNHADSEFNPFDQSAVHSVAAKTFTIVMSVQQISVGTVQDFSTRFFDAEEKISIPHLDGAPRLDKVTEALEAISYRQKLNSMDRSVIIFAPDPLIPMPIVIQSIHFLRQTLGFQAVVLATGFA
jgi:hypothetical protein